MLSQIPFESKNLNEKDLVKEILRVALIAELDAINLYEQLASMTNRDDIKKMFMEIAGEEKTHVGEFQAMLLREDAEQVAELDKGRKEVEELLKPV